MSDGARADAIALVQAARRSLAAYDAALRALESHLGTGDVAALHGAEVAAVLAPPPPPRAASNLPELLTVAEAAALLGICPSSIYKLVEADKLPGIKRIGRRIRFARDVLVAWLASNEQRVPRPKGKR